MSEWIGRPLPEIASALRNGLLSARELTEEGIARHERWDLELGAYKTWDSSYARHQADAADALAIALCHAHTNASLISRAGLKTYRRGRAS